MSTDAKRRIARTVLQIVAGGGLTWLFEQLAMDLPPSYTVYVWGCATLLVTVSQMLLEDFFGKGLMRDPNGPPSLPPGSN